jgi:hypothetical protein
LTWRIGLDPGTAREKVRVAHALGTLPQIDEAFASGNLSHAKVRAVTRVATPQTEERVLAVAMATTGAQLERICRRLRTATEPDWRWPRPAPSAAVPSAAAWSGWRSC